MIQTDQKIIISYKMFENRILEEILQTEERKKQSQETLGN